jgi:quercetin dioxygenase-like cupin family protein
MIAPHAREDAMNKFLWIAALMGLIAATPAMAGDAPPGMRRTELQRVPVPGTDFVAIVMRTELDVGVVSGMHTHPGDETGVVLSGQLMLSVQGQPDRLLKAGDSYLTQAGVPHNAVNPGPEVYSSIATYIVDSTKPITTPVQ